MFLNMHYNEIYDPPCQQIADLDVIRDQYKNTFETRNRLQKYEVHHDRLNKASLQVAETKSWDAVARDHTIIIFRAT